jgi:hypothetical protein
VVVHESARDESTAAFEPGFGLDDDLAAELLPLAVGLLILALVILAVLL